MAGISRGRSLRWLGLSTAALASGALPSPVPPTKAYRYPAATDQAAPGESPEVVADRARRMQWWNAARFGMFIHWGLYSDGLASSGRRPLGHRPCSAAAICGYTHGLVRELMTN